MRLLTLSSLYPSTARPRHGLFVAARLRELRQRYGFDAHVIAPVPWFPFTAERFGDYAAWARTPAHEDWQGQPVDHPRYLMLPKIGMVRQPDAMARAAIACVERQQLDFDVIDAHYFYPDGVAAAALSRHFGKPLVITARGSDLNLVGLNARARARMLDACDQASACVGVSQALVDVLRGWGVPAEKLHVIRNGVDLNRFARMSQAAARATLGLDASPRIFSAGNLIELKGHALLIEAVHLLKGSCPQLQLAIAGEGPERAHLESLISQWQLEGRVRLLGSIGHDALAQWYAASDLFVLPSSREGLPNVLLESLACGTPVLASAVGGVPEVLADAPQAGELLRERNGAAIAEAVCRWLQRGVDRDAVRQVAHGYAWDASAEKLARLMRNVAQEPSCHA